MKKNSNVFNKYNAIIIAGPTAVGKTALTRELAKALDSEIISADSMQIYKGFTIGAATPTLEERQGVTHHLMSHVDPKTPYSVSEYASSAKAKIHELIQSKKIPIITGGTGLYINSLLYKMDFNQIKTDPAIRQRVQQMLDNHGSMFIYEQLKEYDIDAANRIHPNNTRKVSRALEVALQGGQSKDFKSNLELDDSYSPILFVLNRERKNLYERIEQRVDFMLKDGLVDEVKNLMNLGLTRDFSSMKGIGYKETVSYLDGEINYQELAELIKLNTRHYAKRQLTWFNRYQNAHWIQINESTSESNVVKYIIDILN